MEGRLYTSILEKRKIGRRIGENWSRRNARIEFEKFWPHQVTIIEKMKVFNGMAFSDGWLTRISEKERPHLTLSSDCPEDYKEKIVNWLRE